MCSWDTHYRHRNRLRGRWERSPALTRLQDFSEHQTGAFEELPMIMHFYLHSHGEIRSFMIDPRWSGQHLRRVYWISLRIWSSVPLIYPFTRIIYDSRKPLSLSVCLSACLSLCLFVCLSVGLSVCLSVCLSRWKEYWSCQWIYLFVGTHLPHTHTNECNKGCWCFDSEGKTCLLNVSLVIWVRYKTKAYEIFDTEVQPVILYAAGIWGLHRQNKVQRVHTFDCKRYLNVPFILPNKVVYGETGRNPLYVNSAIRCIKHWLRILKLDSARLPKQAYTILLNMDDRGNNYWVRLSATKRWVRYSFHLGI